MKTRKLRITETFEQEVQFFFRKRIGAIIVHDAQSLELVETEMKCANRSSRTCCRIIVIVGYFYEEHQRKMCGSKQVARRSQNLEFTEEMIRQTHVLQSDHEPNFGKFHHFSIQTMQVSISFVSSTKKTSRLDSFGDLII